MSTENRDRLALRMGPMPDAARRPPVAGQIQQMKAEIADAKRFAAAGNWEDAMALAGQKKVRGSRKD